MLEKIADIRFSNQMNEKKSGYKSKHGNSHSLSKSNHFDSINISPAFLFMTKVNAKVQNIFNTISNKYELVFELDGFIYDLILDLPHLFDKNEIQFKIKSIKKELSSACVFLKISFDKDFDEKEISTKNIDVLFQRISDAGFTNESSLFDTELINFLLDGIENEILSDLQSIAKLAILFVEKLYEIKIIEKTKKITDANNIQIQLIKSTDFMRLQKSE